ncbi:transposase [Parachlamydia acanthamoebae UV-7]|jgi:hypothetical protein|uniref:Transposase n=2 Tax=Parachlamydia acanthamoebae TaxID=83552 RepID=F8L2K6_PARAV|nr:transposase [Parachlamydia acanthamoebae]CCB85457.1 transposase [Parachlamydia acanthamoebae UV-7]CCB87501.1 transposase [Parachlamydia acanthamoebae UV-7]CCB87528.1 transposase [Parachlamydia acanthamoebae UV-7]
MTSFRKYLGAPGLLSIIHKQFLKIPDPREFTKNVAISITDHLMSGIAVFGLKCPSLLDYDRKRSDNVIAQNLRDLYHINNPPSDTYLRERLDYVDPDHIRPAFKKVFAFFQRGKGLEGFEYLNGYVLISGDGTGEFSSGNICCPQCCVKEHQNGTKTYYHQMFGACIVHPDKKNVIPLCPEAILNRDGSSKNDCERNACKRFLENFRREHPHLKAILVEDSLNSTAPHIRMIEEFGLKYILGAKRGDHQFLFEQLETSKEACYHEIKTQDGYYHQFRFLNGVSLNKSNQDVKVNILEYRQTDPKGRELNFSWITNLLISTINAQKIAEGGRARWKIENETFNTLKNLGYNFGHNYGHGKKYLSTVLCLLMMLAFLVDQVQEICCSLFQRCKKFAGTYRNLWETMRALFHYVRLVDWENFYLMLSKQKPLNTS